MTEVLDLADATVARRELTTLWGDQFERACRNYFEPECDSSALVALVRSEGSTAFEGLYQTFMTDGAKHPRTQFKDVFEPLVTKWLDSQFKQADLPTVDWNKTDVWDSEAFKDLMKRLLVKLLAKTVKRRDGQPVDAELVVAGWLSDSESPEQKKWDTAWKLAETQYPGGKDAFSLATQKLGVRIFGIHGGFMGLFASPHRFRYTVKMPGVLVESNGELLSDRAARWQFTASEAFPFGYSMRARSIVTLDAAFPGMPRDWAADRQNGSKLIELAGQDEPLAQAMRESRGNRSLHPLEKHAQSMKDAVAGRRARQVLLILKTGKRG